MKKKTILLVVLTILTVILVYFLTRKENTDLHQKSSPVPTYIPAPTPNAPKTFQFNSSTDLMMELEKVNPVILDSDFE